MSTMKTKTGVRWRPWSATAQDAGEILARRGIGEIVDRAQPGRGGAGLGECPRRIRGFLDRGPAVGQRDDRGVAGRSELEALEAQRADAGCSLLQHDGRAAVLRKDIEDGAAHADGRKRRGDLVGGFFRMSRDKAERAAGQADCDVAIAALVIEDGAVELEARIGAERKIWCCRPSRSALRCRRRSARSRREARRRRH